MSDYTSSISHVETVDDVPVDMDQAQGVANMITDLIQDNTMEVLGWVLFKNGPVTLSMKELADAGCAPILAVTAKIEGGEAKISLSAAFEETAKS